MRPFLRPATIFTPRPSDWASSSSAMWACSLCVISSMDGSRSFLFPVVRRLTSASVWRTLQPLRRNGLPRPHAALAAGRGSSARAWPADQPAVLHRLAHALVQREQAHGVGDGGARLADRRGGVLLCHVIGLNERFVTLGLFDGVQVLALQVFNQRQLHRLAVVRLDDDGGHLRQTGKPRSAPGARRQ